MTVERLSDDVRPYEGRKHFVFASFAYQDVPRVEPWLRALGAAGVRVWFDRGLGSDRPDALGRTVARCSAFLLFRSGHSDESRSVREELGLARESGKPVGVVFLDSGVAPSDAAFAVPGDADPARLVAALPVEVREIPRAERRRAAAAAKSGAGSAPAGPGSVADPGASDRNRIVYLLLAAFFGLWGVQYLYARRPGLFILQAALGVFTYFVLPDVASSRHWDGFACWFAFLALCSVNIYLWISSFFRSRDGEGRRMPFRSVR